jgi:phenolphthiocerol/phthiocerol/phthiodiolone dimycocerosyl transferase
MPEIHAPHAVDDAAQETQFPVRSLAPSEEWFVAIGAYVGYSVHVRGELDSSAMSHAFANLLRAYPVLATHLAAAGNHHLIVRSSCPVFGISVYDGGIDEPTVGLDLDPAKRVAAVHVARSADRAIVTLLIHHSIADGHHAKAVLVDLWSFYTDIAGGTAPETGRYEYPDSVEKLFADRGLGDFKYAEPPAGAMTHQPRHRTDIHLPAFTTACERCQLSVEASRALAELSRRRELTINSLVSAAIILTESDVRDISPSEIPYFTIVDLRNRITPPVDSTAGTNVWGFAGFSASTDTGNELIALAGTIFAQLSARLADGTVIGTALQPQKFLAGLKSPVTPESVITTNLGTIPAMRSPAGIEFEDFRAIFYNRPQDPHALIPTQTPEFHRYVISSFCGRLSIELLVPNLSDLESARNKVAILQAHLHSIV